MLCFLWRRQCVCENVRYLAEFLDWTNWWPSCMREILPAPRNVLRTIVLYTLRIWGPTQLQRARGISESLLQQRIWRTLHVSKTSRHEAQIVGRFHFSYVTHITRIMPGMGARRVSLRTLLALLRGPANGTELGRNKVHQHTRVNVRSSNVYAFVKVYLNYHLNIYERNPLRLPASSSCCQLQSRLGNMEGTCRS